MEENSHPSATFGLQRTFLDRQTVQAPRRRTIRRVINVGLNETARDSIWLSIDTKFLG